MPSTITVAGAIGAEEVRGVLGRPAAQHAEPWLECRLESRVPDAPEAGASPPQEMYQLQIRDGPTGPRVTVTAIARAGLIHGLRTLRQLLRQYGSRQPCLTIGDSPAFATRGVMLDISRNRVPTMNTLLRIVDELAALKFNHLQLYTEHTFAYAGHEEVWKIWSPMTPDEVRRLDEHCRSRGVVLAANQNCFGHLSEWLKGARYAPLAEIQGAETQWQFYQWNRKGPFSLCPIDPGSIALVEGLLGQLLPCFSSGLVNINCDETADVGQGRSREEVARRGVPAVYFDYVGKVVEAVRRHNFRPMFWADIALKYPESVGLIPQDLLALAWGYEPDAPFENWCHTLRAAGREVWVCPGTSSWRSITGRTTERRGNIGAAVKAGAACGASGVLTCDWGDLGHRQVWSVSFNALAYAADAAWHGTTEGYDGRAASLHAFNDASLEVSRWLDEVGDADVDLRAIAAPRGADGRPTRLKNASALFTDLHEPLGTVSHTADERPWAEVVLRLEGLRESMPTVAPASWDSQLCHTLEVAILAARRAVLRRRPGAIDAADAARLCEMLRDIIDAHRIMWLAESRPSGLQQSLAYYRTTLAELESVAG